MKQQIWLSPDDGSENRTKMQILGFNFGAISQQTIERQCIRTCGRLFMLVILNEPRAAYENLDGHPKFRIKKADHPTQPFKQIQT
jgi:hypothetical protein